MHEVRSADFAVFTSWRVGLVLGRHRVQDCASVFSSSSPFSASFVPYRRRVSFVSCVSFRGYPAQRLSQVSPNLVHYHLCICVFYVCFCASLLELRSHICTVQVTKIVKTLNSQSTVLILYITGPGCNLKPSN